MTSVDTSQTHPPVASLWREQLRDFLSVEVHRTQLEKASHFIDALPQQVKRSAAWRRLNEEVSIADQLAFLLHCSEFCRDAMQRDASLLASLIRTDVTADLDVAALEQDADKLLGEFVSAMPDREESEAAFMAALRQWRCLQLCRIAWRDLLCLAATSKTLDELSQVADVAVRMADEYAFKHCCERYGIPVYPDSSKAGATNSDEQPQRLITLAMGKLGGHELNFSSDIDLIFAFPANAETVPRAGSAQVSVEEFFHKQVQLMTRLLSATTDDGFVYRVDLRLRPFGSSGPLALSFDGLSHYYQTQGREWERYAMIKARAITGDSTERDRLLAILQPFVYRRYPDYSVFASLRDLKTRITSQLESKSTDNNIKTGNGGIREIEFIGQALQLLHGGRDADLQQRGIQTILDVLSSRAMLTSEHVLQLKEAYEFLRRLENRLQILRDQQVHVLPTATSTSSPKRSRHGFSNFTPGRSGKNRSRQSGKTTQGTNQVSDRQRIAHAMLFEETDKLDIVLDTHRQNVHRIFSDLFRFDSQSDAAEYLPNLTGESGGWRALLATSGFHDVDSLAASFSDYMASPGFSSLVAASRQRVESLLPLFPAVAITASQAAFAAASKSGGADRMEPDYSGAGAMRAELLAGPDHTLLRLLYLVRHLSGRSGYLQILLERPEALELLAALVARSGWLTEFIMSHPIVIDELLNPSAIHTPPGQSDIAFAAVRLKEQLASADLEQGMDAVRHFRLAQTLRVVMAWLLGQIDVQLSAELLSCTAETALQQVAQFVNDDAQTSAGLAGVNNKKTGGVAGKANLNTTVEFAVVAYGKLGSEELGLESDLDIIFLYDSVAGETADDSSDESHAHYSRLARKIVHFVTTMTPAGVLYPIDTRLRPNGRAGMLVSTLEAFERYQREQAWVWEHQALVRTRVVVGSDTLKSRFDCIRARILSMPRDRDEVAEAVADMRRKMYAHLSSESEQDTDYKQGTGGIVDVEFIAQFLVLTESCNHPDLLQPRDTVGILETAARLNIIGGDVARTLVEALLCWRLRMHEQVLLKETRLGTQPTPDIPAGDPELREQVSNLWRGLLPDYH